MQVYSGRNFDFEKPTFNIIDIAYALSNICRFNGHCNRFYSVLEHSFLTSIIALDLVEEARYHVEPGDIDNLIKMALLHDAAEAYIGDLVTPMQYLCPELVAKGKQYQSLIYEKYNCVVTPEAEALVHEADRIALATERRDLLNVGDEDVVWRQLPEPSTWSLKIGPGHEELRKLVPTFLLCIITPQRIKDLHDYWDLGPRAQDT
jgi:uncharacterized protein